MGTFAGSKSVVASESYVTDASSMFQSL